MVELAGAANVDNVVEKATVDPRYAAARNARSPRKIGSHLQLFDCINCDKCIPVCPNDANFVDQAKSEEIEFVDYRFSKGTWVTGDGGTFRVAKEHQIANYADFCNDCGNCDVFCPEDGGPFVEKPRFFSSLESWGRDAGPGFCVRLGRRPSIWGRFADGKEHLLQVDLERRRATFRSGPFEVDIDLASHQLGETRFPRGDDGEGSVLPMRVYHVLRALLMGVLDASSVNYINVQRF
jgi:putative selenate reductase